MAERFKKGDELYLMVKVYAVLSGGYDYTIEWKDVVDGLPSYANVGQAQLVSNADFGTSNGTDWQSKYDEIEELKTRNTELEALLKEVTATRDEAVKQNNELIAENEHQKSACEEQKRLAQNWKENAYKLDKEKEELLNECEKLKADLANKACDEGYDAHVDLVTARAAIDLLQEENNKLKREVTERDELLSDAADRIKTLEEAADRSIFFEKIANQQEVIDALVEKIRRLKGGET